MSPDHYVWDFGAFFKYLPFLLQGMEVTILVSLLSMAVNLLSSH